MNPPEPLPLAIIGAGIGGLAAAISLQRAGFHVELYEQAPGLRDIGAGIGLRPRTVAILHSWGLTEEFHEYTLRFSSIEFFDGSSGDQIGEITFPSETEDPAENWADTISRADFHQLLAAQIPAGRIHLSRQCRAVVDHGDHVEIQFADGTSERAAAVIAADGIHSAIRPLINQAPDHRMYAGVQDYRLGSVPTEQVKELLPRHLPCEWRFTDAGVVCIAFPLRRGTEVSFAAMFPTAEPGDESWRATVPREVFLDKLDELKPHPDLRELVRRIAETQPEVGIFSLYDRDVITHWTSNRVTLLGDAAHPMLPAEGQGANQAIQDAVVLGDCLRGVDDAGIPVALQRYSDVRAPITSEIHRMSRARHAARMRGED